MDGSQKVPYRLLDSLRARQAMGLNIPHLRAGVLAWIDFISHETAEGRPLNDPRARELAQAIKSDDPIAAILKRIDAADLTSLISG